MKTETVFSAIREINEILSLTNEPDKLVNTALDTLSQILNIECCWIQTIRDREKQQLALAADHGFSDKMRSEVAAMDMTQDFCGQVIGMGNKIVIPDLNADGAYGLASFRESGYKWLVAVPLMTYRAWGLLGTASKNRKNLDKDTAELIMVIAGLIANALSKSHLAGSFIRRGQLPEVIALQPDKIVALSGTATKAAPAAPEINPPPEVSADSPLEVSSTVMPPVDPVREEPEIIKVEKKAPAEKVPSKKPDPVFHSHTRKMESFKKTHR